MADNESILNDIKDLYIYCKRRETDNYTASEIAEEDGRERVSDSMFGESIAYCHMAHKLDELINDWETALYQKKKEA